MMFVMRPADQAHYSTRLSFNAQQNRLNWISESRQDALLLQGQFEAGPDSAFVAEVLPRMADLDFPPGQFVEVLPGLRVCYVPHQLKVVDSGIEPPVRGTSYTILSIDLPAGVKGLAAGASEPVIVYEPFESPGNSPRCDVPLTIRVGCKKGKRIERRCFFKTEEVDSGFWEIRFRGDVEFLQTGDVVCRIGDFEVPVTAEMANAPVAYIRSRRKPDFVGARPGVHVI